VTPSGHAYWVTGLSSTGKSSVAQALRELLIERGIAPVVLDGDQLRAALPWPTGYERDERLALARFYARLTCAFVEQGHVVICATVSLFHDVHAWNREHIARYVEVWLRAPPTELERRDRTRHVYAPGRPSVVGRDIAPEFPTAPDIIIDNYGATTPAAAARRILECSGA